MKIINAKRILPSLLLGTMLLCNPLFAYNDDGAMNKTSDQVSVRWTDPAQFTETKYGPHLNQSKSEVWLTKFQKTLVKSAGAVLKPGQHLDVEITDVNLAGHVQRVPGTNGADVRVVKWIYPPEINLTFMLTSADGQVLDSGERKLRDVAFLDRRPISNDPYRFENSLLKDWVSTEFGKR